MDLSGDAFFSSYLRALTDKRLKALHEWYAERITDSNDDAIKKKRLIYNEIRRRDDRQRH